MTEQEAAALEALKAHALAVRRYNTIIDTPGMDFSSPTYIDAANAMDATETALIEAAEPLLTP